MPHHGQPTPSLIGVNYPYLSRAGFVVVGCELVSGLPWEHPLQGSWPSQCQTDGRSGLSMATLPHKPFSVAMTVLPCSGWGPETVGQKQEERSVGSISQGLELATQTQLQSQSDSLLNATTQG